MAFLIWLCSCFDSSGSSMCSVCSCLLDSERPELKWSLGNRSRGDRAAKVCSSCWAVLAESEEPEHCVEPAAFPPPPDSAGKRYYSFRPEHHLGCVVAVGERVWRSHEFRARVRGHIVPPAKGFATLEAAARATRTAVGDQGDVKLLFYECTPGEWRAQAACRQMEREKAEAEACQLYGWETVVHRQAEM